MAASSHVSPAFDSDLWPQMPSGYQSLTFSAWWVQPTGFANMKSFSTKRIVLCLQFMLVTKTRISKQERFKLSFRISYVFHLVPKLHKCS